MAGLLAVANYEGERALGTVTFGTRDASVYVRPISGHSLYDYGVVTFPALTHEYTFQTVGQLRAEERPHLSIHESGKCHVRTSGGPVSGVNAPDIGPLKQFTGAHVASIYSSDYREFPLLDDAWPGAPARDHEAEAWEITPPAGKRALRLVVSVSRRPHAHGTLHPDAFRYREVRRRRSDGGTLFVAVYAKAEGASLGEGAIGVFGGWDPAAAFDAARSLPFLFVRDAITPGTS